MHHRHSLTEAGECVVTAATMCLRHGGLGTYLRAASGPWTACGCQGDIEKSIVYYFVPSDTAIRQDHHGHTSIGSKH